MPVALTVVAALVVLTWLARREDLFCLSVRDGRVLVVRGRAPRGFVSDVRDIVARTGARRGEIRALRAGRGARLVISGLDEATEQRVRNVFGIMPAVQLLRAPPIESPTLGQSLGIAWLAWMLDRSPRG